MLPESRGQYELYDITILGAGPAGLFAAFYAGLRDMSVKIIEAREEPGGQLTAIYPDKYVYDVPGFPRVLARELVRQQLKQIERWQTTKVFGERVSRLYRAPEDDHWILESEKGQHHTRTVVVAAGAGAFQPRKLGVPEVDDYRGEGVYYYVKDKENMRGKRLLIVGGGDSAVDWALELSGLAAHVTLVHRRGEFNAHPAMVAELAKSPVEVRLNHELRAVLGSDHVTAARVADNRTGAETVLEVDAVLLALGFKADPGPVSGWGLKMADDRHILVNAKQETNLPGVYAVGDIARVEGADSIKLIVMGYAQAAMAVSQAYRFIHRSAPLFAGHSSAREL